MKKNLFQNTLKGIGCILLSVLLTTCDVGLGPSVDTKAPELDISSPVTGAVMKGTLSLGGKASDDGTIKSIIVNLDGIGSTTEKYSNLSADIDVENKRWSLTVPTVGESGIKDGTYKITVTATDDSERVSEQSTTFSVDNTAPVIMLDSPDLKQASMNYDIQLEGKIYDTSEIKEINVVICNSSGEEVITKKANLSGSSAWKITFSGDDDLGIAQGAPLLSENRNYYYYIVASDEIDNKSTYFFHKPDVYEKYTGSKLSIDEWAEFDKGETDKVSGQTLDREWFNGIRISTEPLNLSEQTNLPKFSYSQSQVAGISWSNISTGSSLNKGDSIIGSITPPTGVDSPFVNDTFKCYIRSGSIPFVLDPEQGLTGVQDWWGNTTVTNVGTSRNFSISTVGLIGDSFVVYIEIKNSSGTKFFAQQSFDINLSTPLLEITNLPELQKTTNNKDFVFEGTALVSSEEHACELYYTVKKDGILIVTGKDDEPGKSVASIVFADGTWSLPAFKKSDGTFYEEGRYDYEFIAKSGSFKSIQSRTITLDNTNPPLSISDVSQNVSGNMVTASGSTSDSNGLASMKYCLVPSSRSPVADDWVESNAIYNWVHEIDTTSYSDDEHIFYIEVIDTAGNKSTAQKSIVIDKDSPSTEITDNAGWVNKEIQTIT